MTRYRKGAAIESIIKITRPSNAPGTLMNKKPLTPSGCDSTGRMHMTSSPPYWRTFNKRFLIGSFVMVHQHGRQANVLWIPRDWLHTLHIIVTLPHSGMPVARRERVSKEEHKETNISSNANLLHLFRQWTSQNIKNLHWNISMEI